MESKGFFEKYFSGLSLNTFLLTFASFFADISTEILYPVLPLFLTEVLKSPATVVGLVEGVAQATQNIVQGFSGWIADRFQKRKLVALFGYGIAALSKPLIGFSAVWPQVLGARFLDRTGTGIRSAPRDALIAASADEANRGKAFGLEGIGDNLGAVVGPSIAIVLLFYFHDNLRQIFYFAFLPGLLAFLMILLVKETKVVTSEKIKLNFGSFSPNYWRYLFATLVFGIGNSSNAFLILRAKNIGMSTEATIFIYALFNLVAAISSFPSGALSDRLGRKGILLLCFAVFIVTYAGFAMTTNWWVVAALFILYGFYSGVFRAVGKALATDFSTSDNRATAIGIYSSAIGVTGLIASLVAGELWVKVNPSSVFVFGAIFALIGTLSFLVLVPNQNKK